MSIYIYRKTHNVTGLKYIGKFTALPEDAYSGGHGGRPDLVYTPEVRKRMSEAKLKTIREKGTAFLTRPHTDESKKKMSLASKGKKKKRIECKKCGAPIAPNWVKDHAEKCNA